MVAARARQEKLLTIIPPPNSGKEPSRHRIAEVSGDRLYNALGDGESIRLMMLEEYWPPIAAMAAALRGSFDAKVSVGFYMTPPDSQAFPIHFDSQDNFIVQVDGWKKWYVYEAEYPFPMDAGYVKDINAAAPVLDESTARPRECARLEKGDVLYIPRGFYHKAVTSNSTSLHLTVSILPICWADFIKHAVELLCIDHVEFRKSIPPGFISHLESRGNMLSSFQSLLQLVSTEASFDETLRSLTERELLDRAYPPDGHFGELSRAAEVRPDSLVERRAGMTCWVELTSDSATIRFGRNRVQGPPPVAPALEFICSHKQFYVEQLPGGLSERSKLVLVRRLVREGLLRTVRSGEVGAT